MICSIRNTFSFKVITVLILVVFLNSIFFPTISFALSGGPSQPEVHSFAPIGTTDMVDLSSGDFNYNLPLLDVGGYPINMVYNSGITMDQEASWVGLGWNLNPGVINRSMRGLPDDFKGDLINNEFNMKRMVNSGIMLGADVEVFGLSDLLNLSIGASFGINYSNYTGYNFVSTIGMTANATMMAGERNKGSIGLNLTVSQGGRFSGNVSFSESAEEKTSVKTTNRRSSIGLSFDNDGFTGFNASTSSSSKKNESTSSDASTSSSKTTGKTSGKKKKQGAMSLGYNFADKTYSPSINFARYTGAITFSAKIGGTAFGIDGSLTTTAFQNWSQIKSKSENSFGYGYLYLENADENTLMDFNRENDGSYHKRTTNLPITNLTYDLYSVNGQGVSGTFRAHRGNVGSVKDKLVKSDGADGSGGFEAALGNAFSNGFDAEISEITSFQRGWNQNNGAIGKLSYTAQGVNDGSGENNDYEPFYFKQIGEISIDEEMEDIPGTMYNDVVGNKAVRVKLGNDHNAFSTYVSDINTLKPITSKIQRTRRARRNVLMTYLTKAEAQLLGKPVNTNAQNHHIAEMAVVKDDGSRYVYGKSAYNKVQEEYYFNVSGLEDNDYCGFVGYTSAELSKENDAGMDNFYSKKNIPPFAHSYLLTEILSPDYIDVDDNGPSSSDYGTWTKFEYEKKDDDYKWRTPYTPNGEPKLARLSRGLISVDNDSKANIVYGEKELYYLKKITTKTQVAVFYTSKRKDAYEAGGRDGERGANPMYKLDKIELFNKADYTYSDTPIPIKTIHFKYSYSLCKGIYNSENFNPNSNSVESGKLTLEGVYFSYGTSKKGMLSPYTFTYGNSGEGLNPDYDPNAYDMWGANKTTQNDDCVAISEFPYVDQSSSPSELEKRAKAWTLKSIDLPSGGKIEIDFENDDYGYVQNKKAMQFYKILGFSDGSSEPSTGSNNYSATYDDSGSKEFVYIDAPGLSNAEAAKLTEGLLDQYIYFRFKMQLAIGQDEYISGYFKIDDSFAPEYFGSRLKIKVKNFQLGDGIGINSSGTPYKDMDVSPFAKAAWQFAKINRPGLAKNQSSEVNDDISLTELKNGVLGVVDNLKVLWQGVNKQLMSYGIGKYVDVDKSWIRLNNPNGKKIGGNSRVSSISMRDNWSKMTSSTEIEDALYTQKFTYENEDGTSSGVADWEPTMSKENPFVLPVAASDINELTGMEFAFSEQPLASSFYPAPKVVYGRVVVNDVAFNNGSSVEIENNLSRTGKVESQFYTSKDFPTKVRQTTIDTRPSKPNLVSSFIGVGLKDYMTVSQGYSIELNDMSGKAKSVKVYAEDVESPISAIYYNYDPNSEDATPGPFALNDESNKVIAIYPDGSVKSSTVGVEMETVNDFREFKSRTITGGTDGNLAAFLAVLFPAVIPVWFPSVNSYTSIFRSAVTTKVIFRRGILRKVTKVEDNSSFSTENLAYDSETGEVLLTGTKNEFGDEIFNFNYPVHWMYDGMGQAYKNTRLSGRLEFANSADIEISDLKINDVTSQGLVNGDELFILEGNEILRCWVANVGDEKFLIDKEGLPYNPVEGDGAIKIFMVIKSGRSNQQSLSAGSITCMENPIEGTEGNYSLSFNKNSGVSIASSKVLDASTQRYSDHWATIAKKLNSGDPSPNDWGTYTINQGETTYNDFSSDNEEFITNSYKNFLNSLIVTQKNWENSSGGIGLNYLGNNNNMIIQPTLSIDNGVINYQDIPQTEVNMTQLPYFSIDGLQALTFVPSFGFSYSDLYDVNGLSPDTIMYTPIFHLSKRILNVQGVNFLNNLAHNYYNSGWAVTDVEIVSLVENTIEPTIVDSIYTFNVTISNGYNTEVEQLKASGWPIMNMIDSWSYMDSTMFEEFCPGVNVVNPYLTSIRGKWRPETQYVYKSDRTYAYLNESPDLRNSGTYENITPYWYYDGSKWMSDDTGWQYTSTITEYSPFGNEVENQDALGRYSTALFGYHNNLPKAVAQNARYNEVYSENFEDYLYPVNNGCFYTPHFLFASTTGVEVSEAFAHTGKYSLMISSNQNVTANNDYIKKSSVLSDNTKGYTLTDSDFLGGFSPSPLINGETKKFIMSYWIKESDIDEHSVIISVYDGVANPITLNALTGANPIIIDGWRRVEYTFDLSHFPNADPGVISLRFISSSSNSIYIDDIRIQPFNSSMKAFVYHPITQKYVAELDENNYATFYEYDNEGRLLRIKKETERGIMTIQESRTNSSMDDNALPQ